MSLFSSALLVYKPTNTCMDIAERSLHVLRQHGLRVSTITVDDIASARALSLEEPREIDLVVAVGGNGTFMKSAKVSPRTSFILPYPCGRRNVYYEHGLPSIDVLIERVLKGDFFVEFLPKYHVCSELDCVSFINDVVIVNVDLGKVSSYAVSILSPLVNSELVFEGDGVILSTSTGSGGHNLSARGPLITPALEALVITPLNPIQATITSIVASSFSKIVVKARNKAAVYVDGDIFTSIEKGGSVEIPGHAEYVKVIRFNPTRDLVRVVFESRRHIYQ